MKASAEAARRTTCRRCGQDVLWALSEARGFSLMVDPEAIEPTLDGPDPDDGRIPDEDSGYDLAFTGDTRRSARGEVPVVHWVQPGTGSHRLHAHPSPSNHTP